MSHEPAAVNAPSLAKFFRREPEYNDVVLSRQGFCHEAVRGFPPMAKTFPAAAHRRPPPRPGTPPPKVKSALLGWRASWSLCLKRLCIAVRAHPRRITGHGRSTNANTTRSSSPKPTRGSKNHKTGRISTYTDWWRMRGGTVGAARGWLRT